MSLIEKAGLAALHRLDPEKAHRLAIRALKAGFGPKSTPDPMLATRVFGIDLPSPVGVAAGFDKNAEAPRAMLQAGFGFMEIGAVTPKPQEGNPKPRLFRLDEDRAAINRFGFNNEGLEAIAARLEGLNEPRIWANLGANKTSEDRAADYVAVMRGLHGLVGAMTLNVSSPNTEKLRDLQGPAALEALISKALEARDELAKTAPRTPVLVKIAPDLTEQDIQDIAAVALNCRIDGIIATNTTLSREGLRSRHAAETGGLSGAPLTAASLRVLKQLHKATKSAIPLIGVGGIGSAEEAYARIRAGASAVQLYTAMVYEGPSLGARISQGLVKLLKRDGFQSVVEAVGADQR